ncbi:hypothetical protein IM40_05100 [Candidatus Paracaedimonas acanthamoebae]|nr:hypothetical protein IM40_05100 [Candidatus Paracaedimonas acanthamoebae]
MIKNLFLGAAIVSLFGATVNANELHDHHTFTADELKVVADEILKEIKDGTIAKNEQNEAYELVGGLQVCSPIVKKAAELREKNKNTDHKAEPKKAEDKHEKVQASADDLSAVVTKLVADLQEGTVDAKDHAEIFELIGGLKMCEPIVKNVATLRAQQHKEATEKTAGTK